MTLEQMRNIDIRTVDPSTLRDRKDVKIDRRLPREKRIRSYCRQIGNPYCYIDEGIIVKVSFEDTSATIDDRLEAYARSRM